MRRLTLFAALLAILSGCGGGPASVPPLAPAAAAPLAPAPSWMKPEAKSENLLYISVAGSTEAVEVYTYPGGTLAGNLGGFDGPLGQCVDARGDVYIVALNDGRVVEYPHGGTHVIRTYKVRGYPVGCSVDKNDDLAVTSYETTTGPGAITVFHDHNGGRTVYNDPAECYYLWPAGYDDKGNLFVEGRSSPSGPVTVCALFRGKSAMQRVTTQGITIHAPGSVMWDGKYIALTDQNARGQGETGIWHAWLSGTTLRAPGETLLSDHCKGKSADVSQPFIVGAKNTPLNDTQGHVVVGENLSCPKSSFAFWHYPSGGIAYKHFQYASFGASVSLATHR